MDSRIIAACCALSLLVTVQSSPIDNRDGCYFDGKLYARNEEIVIANCLGVVTCLGSDVLGNMEQWGGVCPEKRQLPGQTGCLFDGKVYKAGEKIVIANCLGEMTCLGNNNLGDLVSWGGVCPEKRQLPGQTGCLFDGKVYKAGEKIVIAKCLGEMTCLGNNNLGNLVSWGGVCPAKREVDGQSGCLFDGRIYSAGEKVIIQKCLAQMTCLGRNSYSPIKSLGGDCSKSD